MNIYFILIYVTLFTLINKTYSFYLCCCKFNKDTFRGYKVIDRANFDIKLNKINLFYDRKSVFKDILQECSNAINGIPSINSIDRYVGISSSNINNDFNNINSNFDNNCDNECYSLEIELNEKWKNNVTISKKNNLNKYIKILNQIKNERKNLLNNSLNNKINNKNYNNNNNNNNNNNINNEISFNITKKNKSINKCNCKINKSTCNSNSNNNNKYKSNILNKMSCSYIYKNNKNIINKENKCILKKNNNTKISNLKNKYTKIKIIEDNNNSSNNKLCNFKNKNLVLPEIIPKHVKSKSSVINNNSIILSNNENKVKISSKVLSKVNPNSFGILFSSNSNINIKNNINMVNNLSLNINKLNLKNVNKLVTNIDDTNNKLTSSDDESSSINNSISENKQLLYNKNNNSNNDYDEDYNNIINNNNDNNDNIKISSIKELDLLIINYEMIILYLKDTKKNPIDFVLRSYQIPPYVMQLLVNIFNQSIDSTDIDYINYIKEKIFDKNIINNKSNSLKYFI